MCRGNFRSSRVVEGGCDHVAEALFGGLAVKDFFLGPDDCALRRVPVIAVRAMQWL
jgi:hypothetical protein